MRSAFLLSCALLVAAPGSAAVRRRTVRQPSGMAAVRNVFVVVLENEDADAALQQPFLHQLATGGAYLNFYHALTHPSQPNYIALTAGSVYGISNDNPVTIDVKNFADALDAAGVDWKVYAEDYPGDCFLGASSGHYVRKHVPFLDYTDVQSDTERCTSHIVNAIEFDADLASQTLPRFAMYIPNTVHDGHDTNVATADAWLASRFGSLLDDSRFIADTLFVVVFDEGRTNGTNVIYCAFYGAGVEPGAVSYEYYDHYDLLRTLETIFRTPSLHHHDDVAKVINDVWRP